MIKHLVTASFLALSWLPAGTLVCANEAYPRRVPSSVPFRFASVSSVSQGFREKTLAATRSIPEQVWERIEKAGWRVQLAEFVVDAVPSLRGVRPRGWPRYLTWENSDAIHLPTSKLLVVAEKRRNSAGVVVPSSRVANVLRHELGHAFDMAVGNGSWFLSSTARFVAAYNQDVAELSKHERERFTYYLQGSRAGWQETFAEAFAVALGGGSSEVEPEDFEAAFPRAVAFARKAIASPPKLASGLKTTSDPAIRRVFWRR